MSSSDEEDIASNLLANGVSSDEESSDDAENAEVQDEILSSDEEDTIPKTKKRKVTRTLAFPTLEAEADDGEDDSAYIESVRQEAARKKAKSKGTFASFGLSSTILANIKRKGYRQPTPIQRKSIPLIMDNRDLVGMARTGSGKTAAFLLPLVEKLKQHSSRMGVRAVVLSPTRELAMQTHKQLNEFAYGTELRTLLLVGGDSLEDQFGAMVNNPDVIVATPGRFLHLKVEMKLDLRTVTYIVYDEADRLFEMGFSEQLNELLASLPDERQSLLFSATLPKNLVEFAKAGLKNPVLVRLDADTKISENLEMAFITTRKGERDGNLLFLLQNVIEMPFATKEQQENFKRMNEWDADDDEEHPRRKHKRKLMPKEAKANELPSEKATMVFVPTRHHVDYVTMMLKNAGYSVSYIYGSLDQHARKRQLRAFRSGVCSIMVVTDVAARGIDIPILANVINYTLPTSSKLFVHRVGRTARAGNRGWAYSIVGVAELPYLLDLEVFLGRKVLLRSMQEKKTEILRKRWEADGKESNQFTAPKVSYTARLVLGSAPQEEVGEKQELCQAILKNDYDLRNQQRVCEKADRMLVKSRQPASAEAARRAKEMVMFGWEDQNLLFGQNAELEKEKLLEKFQHRRRKETVFEMKGADDYLISLMSKRRRDIAPIQEAATKRRELLEEERTLGLTHTLEDELERQQGDGLEIGFTVKDEELLDGFEDADELEEKQKAAKREQKKMAKHKSYRDPQFYMSHYASASSIQDQQLNIGTGGFALDAQRAAFDLNDDDGKLTGTQKQAPRMVWDKKKKKYVRNQDDTRYIIGENGQKLPASFRSGKWDEWRKKHRSDGYRVGAAEEASSGAGFSRELSGGRSRFGRAMHKKDRAPHMPDKHNWNYEKQMEKVKRASERGLDVKGYKPKGKAWGQELRSTEDIRKGRALKAQRKAKNARPSRRR